MSAKPPARSRLCFWRKSTKQRERQISASTRISWGVTGRQLAARRFFIDTHLLIQNERCVWGGQIASLLRKAYNSRRCIGGPKHLSSVTCSSITVLTMNQADLIPSNMCREGFYRGQIFFRLERIR